MCNWLHLCHTHDSVVLRIHLVDCLFFAAVGRFPLEKWVTRLNLFCVARSHFRLKLILHATHMLLLVIFCVLCLASDFVLEMVLKILHLVLSKELQRLG